MNGLLRRARGRAPADPMTPLLTRTITSARPVTSMASAFPGVWLGEGCRLAGLAAGAPADADVLEDLVSVYGGIDVCVREPLDMVRKLAIHRCERGHEWHAELLLRVSAVLPDALAVAFDRAGIELDIERTKYVAGVYTHPIADCWPVDSTIWHAHAIVPGKVWCSR